MAPAAVPDWTRWEPRERAVLVFLRCRGEILLIRKKRGLGAGKINGPGGRIEPGETAAEAALRETREEIGLEPAAVVEAGRLCFQFADGHSIHCTVYTATQWTGELVETDEAAPFWHPEDAMPYAEMWADDIHWIPWMLRGEPFLGRFLFEGDRLLALEVLPAA